ncbi:MAG: type IV pilus assembly protein PilM [Pirellulaceae bacterium]
MANAASVWGIEIGQSALKALRCRVDGDQIVAEAFDYIEYPKILSQPESDSEAMVKEALETFVSRNDLKKTRVALSVPGSSGLAKFFKPPPVELKKLPDIVKYEARQQIPFELDDVVWDYQLMGGSNIADGFALESEVGLFAMKRDAVYRVLKPLEDADIEVDLLQLTPLSIYNMVTFDRGMTDGDVEYDNEAPPKSTIVLAMGTDSTDLIVTNGYRVWQRSMPLGGNHFTRQLTKDLKLTFAKAEHLKRNAMEADDPKLIFQAMRPVFNDLVTEVQRSMGFFRSLNKEAEIGSVVMMGNSVKLPGLSQYLNKNLAMDVEIVEGFNRLQGEDVISAPAFKDHVAAFAPVYGLCLQALNQGPAATNLVPKEVVTERLVRSKKPWAVAAAALLMAGFAGSLIAAGGRYGEVHKSKWTKAAAAADSTKKVSSSAIESHDGKIATVKLLRELGGEISGSGDRRLLWMEVVHALFESLNRPEDFDVANPPDPNELPHKEWDAIFLTKMDSKQFEDLIDYVDESIVARYAEDQLTWKVRLGLLPKPAEGEELDEEAEEEEAEPLTVDSLLAVDEEFADEDFPNRGWVLQLDGYHFHNGREYAATGDELEEFVIKRLIYELETGSIDLPVGDGQTETFTYKDLGLSSPFILRGDLDENNKEPNPAYQKKYGTASSGGGGMGGMGMGGMGGDGGYGGGDDTYGGSMGGMGYGSGGGGAGGSAAAGKDDEEDIPKSFDAPRYNFVLQVIWRETPLTKRLEAKRKAAEAAAEEAELNGEEDADLAGT